MEQPIWIAGFKVDWQRHELYKNDEVISLEPKILAVLKQLVAANGSIVSQQTLLDEVWPEVVVSPNTLQRCIAQIRKLFNDDAKKQQIIKTHPKIGYSFVGEVCYQSAVHKSSFRLNRYRSKQLILASIVFIIIALGYVSFSGLEFESRQIAQSPKKLPFMQTQIHPKLRFISSGQYAESHMALSADEKRLAFIRKLDAQNQHIIIRDRQSGKETFIKLTGEIIGKINFDIHGDKLYFSRIERKKFTKCSSLFELDVQSATEKRLFSCRSQFNHSLTQVSKHSYLYQAMDKIGRSRLMMFDQTSNTSSQLKLLQSTNNVIAWDYHVSSRVLGILQSKGEGASLSYGKLTDEGRLLIQQQLSIEKEFTSQTQLALSVKSQSSDEAVTVALTTNNMIHWYSDRGYINSNAVAHPRNIKQTIVTSNNKLLISLAQNRRKILLVGAQSNTKDISLLDQHYANDRMPRFRPKSDEISFLSDRNGSNQLWLVAGGQVSRLTNSEQGIDEYVWLGRGKDLVYLSNGELRLRKQQGTDIKLAIPQTKLNVLQAIDDHTLLLLLKDGSHGQIVKYSIKTAVLEVIYQGDISWGQLLESRLLFSDSLGTLFEFNLDTKNAQPKLIKPQADFMLHVLFITRDAGIYFQDKKFNIWRYDQTGKIELFDKYEKKTPFIYDIEPTKRRYLAHTFPEKFSQLAELSF